jgi:thiamine biosynthesis lipoprotein
MVNFGGDIRAFTTEDDPDPWLVGIEDAQGEGVSIGMIEMRMGAVTTSGCSYRYCFVNGKRLSHILNPLTGWPVESSPRSVTVIADLCTEAGLLSTLAMLHGSEAEEFLRRQDARFHCVR